MRQIHVIGIGTGNPEHMTLEGAAALFAADVVLLPTKGEDKHALADLRRALCARHARAATRIEEFALPVRDTTRPDYQGGVDDWHAAITARYAALLAQTGARDTIALLVWGDPALYDSTLRILERVRAANGPAFSVRVVPGISALSVLTAAFAIPLNTIGNSVVITTGRLLARGWPTQTDTVAVLLDGRQAFRALTGQGLHIYWGAYLGSSDQILIEGPLDDTAETIATRRGRAREAHGWIMDTYLLRR